MRKEAGILSFSKEGSWRNREVAQLAPGHGKKKCQPASILSQAQSQPFAQPPLPQPPAPGVRAVAESADCVMLASPFYIQTLRMEGRAGMRSQAGSVAPAGPERQSGASWGARAVGLPKGWETSLDWLKLTGCSDAGLADP